MTRKWEIVDDGDRDFVGSYDVWIEEPDKDGEGGQIIAACFRSDALLISAAPDGLALALAVIEAVDGACLVERDHPQRALADVLCAAYALRDKVAA